MDYRQTLRRIIIAKLGKGAINELLIAEKRHADFELPRCLDSTGDQLRGPAVPAHGIQGYLEHSSLTSGKFAAEREHGTFPKTDYSLSDKYDSVICNGMDLFQIILFKLHHRPSLVGTASGTEAVRLFRFAAI